MLLIPDGMTAEEWAARTKENLEYADRLLKGCKELPADALMTSPIDGRVMGDKRTAIETAERYKRGVEKIWRDLVDAGLAVEDGE